MKNTLKRIKIDNYVNTNYGGYILGFIWGDGRIANKTRTDIFIEKNDAVEIYKILKKTKNEWKIGDDVEHGKRLKKYLWFTNLMFTKFLCEYDYAIKSSGIAPNKIFDLLSETNKIYFLRGLIDSDGCIFCSKNIEQKWKIKLIITSNFQQDWSFLESFLTKKFIKYKTRKINAGNKGKWSRFEVTGNNQVVKMLKLIYENQDNIFLMRKYKIWREFENYFSTYKPKIRSKWTKINDSFLIKNYLKLTNDELCSKLNVCSSNLIERKKFLKLENKNMLIKTKEIEKIFSLRNSGLKIKDIGFKMNRSIASIKYILGK
jgi:hypothetical protein